MDKNEEIFGYWEAIISCIKDIVDRRLADEREVCAKIAQELSDENGDEIAAAIRARGADAGRVG